MADHVEQIGIVIRTDGTVELANGMKLSGEQVRNLGKHLDDLSARMGATQEQTENTGRSAADMARDLGQAGQAAVQMGRDLANGDMQSAAQNLGTVAKAAGGLEIGMAAIVGVGAAAAAGIALIAVAAARGSQEAREFSNSIVLTGNFAGVTTNQLMDMAGAMDRVRGTQYEASAALNAMVSTGRIASSQLQLTAEAAESMRRGLGRAVEDTAEDFVKLAEEPAKASARMNEQLHYLDAATWQRIQSLEEQGRKEEAAALAQSTYASAMKQRAEQVADNVGIMQRAWRGLTNVAKEAWDAMLGIGRPDTLSEKIADAEQRLANAQKGTARFSASGQDSIARQEASLEALREMQRLQNRGASAQGDHARDEGEKIQAQQRLEAQRRVTRSRADLRKEEIEQLDRDAKTVGMKKDEYDRRVAAINEHYKDPKTAKPKAYRDDAAERYLQELRDSNAAVLTQLDNEDKLTAAQKKQAEFQQQLADLKEKKILTADQKSLLARQDEIEAQLKVNVENERLLKIKTEQAKIDQSIAVSRSRREQSQQQRDEQYDGRLAVFGLGSEAREQMESTLSIQREFAAAREELTRNATRGKWLDSDSYKDEVRLIESELAEALQKHDKYYKDLKAKQGDWLNGASEAIADFRSRADDVAGQTKDAFGNAFKGMEDALVSFVTTGKVDFKSLANSIIADIVRIQVRAAMASVMGGKDGGDNGLLKLIGGLAGAFGGSAQAAFSQTSLGSSGFGTGLAYGNQDIGQFLHGGGIVGGRPTFTRPVSAGVFAGAPRFHGGGIVQDEVPIIAKKGEGVFTPEQMRSLAPVSSTQLKAEVHVHNNGAPVTAGVTQRQTDDGSLRLDVMLEQIEDAMADRLGTGSGNLARAMEGRYGLRTAVN